MNVFAQPSSGRDGPGVDVVRLAMRLVGVTRFDDVLDRSLDLLQQTQPLRRWAILARVGRSRYRAAAGARVGHTDLRRLVERACGRDVRLSLGEVAPQTRPFGQPKWVAVGPARASDYHEPRLVVAWWPASGEKSPDPREVGALDTAARLISAAADSAGAFESLAEQASRDPLTGLLNRRGILEVLDREVDVASGSQDGLAVLYLDLDGFKQINDRMGHKAGDELLTDVAGVVTCALRATDAVGRIGGDEFLVVLPGVGREAAAEVGRRINRTFGETPVALRLPGPRPSLSFGVATLDEVDSAESLIERADRRMLAAKRRRSLSACDGADGSAPARAFSRASSDTGRRQTSTTA